MNYWHLLLDLLAVVGGSSMLSLLSPWRMSARAIPALLFAVAMIVMALPMTVVVALAMMLPVALIQKYLGIELHGHEPVDVAPAVELARSAAQAARERIRPVKPVEITAFAAHAYPAPGEPGEDDLAHAEAAGDDDSTEDTGSTGPEQTPADALRDKLDQLTSDPAMPAGARARLLGQRAGRDTSIGLRNQHAPVRSFVPAL